MPSLPGIVTPPAELPVSLEELKRHLRIEHDHENDYLESLLAATTTIVEKDTGRSIVETVYTQDFERLEEVVYLRYPPLTGVAGIYYLDESDVEQPVDSAVYRVDTEFVPGRVLLEHGQVWPVSTGIYRIQYTCGYPPGSVPEDVKQSVEVLAAYHFRHRGDTAGEPARARPLGYMSLIRNRVVAWRYD